MNPPFKKEMERGKSIYSRLSDKMVWRKHTFKNPEALELFEIPAVCLATRHFKSLGKTLAPVEALVYRNGWDGNEPRTIREVSELLGMSIPVVQKQYEKAIKYLKWKVTVDKRLRDEFFV